MPAESRRRFSLTFLSRKYIHFKSMRAGPEWCAARFGAIGRRADATNRGSWVTRREVTGCTPREHVNNLQPVSFLPGRVRSVML
jgi:hypothetical protein